MLVANKGLMKKLSEHMHEDSWSLTHLYHQRSVVPVQSIINRVIDILLFRHFHILIIVCLMLLFMIF